MPEQERNVLIMKKLIVCVVCLLLVLLSMAACGTKSGDTLAVWTDGSYAYSISLSTPLSQDGFQAFLEENFA